MFTKTTCICYLFIVPVVFIFVAHLRQQRFMSNLKFVLSFYGENYRRLVLKFRKKKTENERVDWKFMWIFTLSSNIAAPQPTIKKNPLLEALYSVLISQYSRKPESRSIIFVKTREIAKAVLTYINDAPGLSSFNLKSLPMTGTHAKSTQFGKN